ncbi:MAG: hypothetical protein IPN36_15955 [Bacteroidetes bacterium]|nr:hypothetical protein [Bacteroidota bacterium]
MRLKVIIVQVVVAFMFSVMGLTFSVIWPQSDISDLLMNTSLYIVGTSGIAAVLFTKKLTNSKQWKYVLLGGALVLISFVVEYAGYQFEDAVVKVSGGTIAITALGYYVFLNRIDYRDNKWIWLLPLILLGCLFKHMHWTGANIIIFASLLLISINALLQLFRFKNTRELNYFFLPYRLLCQFLFRYFIFAILNWILLSSDIFLHG